MVPMMAWSWVIPMAFERSKVIRLVLKTRMEPMRESRMELGWETNLVDEMVRPKANLTAFELQLVIYLAAKMGIEWENCSGFDSAS